MLCFIHVRPNSKTIDDILGRHRRGLNSVEQGPQTVIVVLTYLALNECRTYTVKSLACVADEIASKTVARSAFSAPTEECHLALARYS